jgi:alpha-galactosidase
MNRQRGIAAMRDFCKDFRHKCQCVDLLRRFCSTGSNGHLSEYLASDRKRRKDLPNRIWSDLWIQGETGGCLRHTRESRNWFETGYLP